MCITSKNHIFVFQNGEFCDDIAILGTKNNILVWFQANFGQNIGKNQFWWAMTQIWSFEAYLGCGDHLIVHFHGLHYEKWCERPIWRILDIKKLCFGALETQFGVKKAKFCELRAKLGYLRSFQARELIWWTIFLV